MHFAYNMVLFLECSYVTPLQRIGYYERPSLWFITSLRMFIAFPGPIYQPGSLLGFFQLTQITHKAHAFRISTARYLDVPLL
jgi:hypothetical protein